MSAPETPLLHSPMVFIWGMPGAGKSWWGERLAFQLGYAFFDLDQELEKQNNASIAQLYKDLGPDKFRREERRVLLEWIDSAQEFAASAAQVGPKKKRPRIGALDGKPIAAPKTPAVGRVLACGGGTPCFFGQAELMNKKGVTVFLDQDPVLLASRLAPELEKRPLFTGLAAPELPHALAKLHEERMGSYWRAKINWQPVEKRIDLLVRMVRKEIPPAH